MIKGKDYIGNCVIFICHDGRGNILMGFRSKKVRDEHQVWDLGGGAVEFEDSVESTLKKEIMEEYCTDVKNYEFLGYRDVQRTLDGKKTHWIALDFLVEVDPDKVKIGEPDKIEKIAWYTLKTIPENSHSTVPVILKNYKKQLSQVLSI